MSLHGLLCRPIIFLLPVYIPKWWPPRTINNWLQSFLSIVQCQLIQSSWMWRDSKPDSVRQLSSIDDNRTMASRSFITSIHLHPHLHIMMSCNLWPCIRWWPLPYFPAHHIWPSIRRLSHLNVKPRGASGTHSNRHLASSPLPLSSSNICLKFSLLTGASCLWLLCRFK